MYNVNAKYITKPALNETHAEIMLAKFAPKERRLFNLSTERDISAYHLKVVLLGKPDNQISSSFEGLGLRLDTVFSWLDVLAVMDKVWVVICFGGGRKVAAIFTELVGYAGFAAFAVILVPGRPCIGAYMIGPDCERKGIA